MYTVHYYYLILADRTIWYATHGPTTVAIAYRQSDSGSWYITDFILAHALHPSAVERWASDTHDDVVRLLNQLLQVYWRRRASTPMVSQPAVTPVGNLKDIFHEVG